MISERLRHLRQQARSVADWLESTWRSVPESSSLIEWQNTPPLNTLLTLTAAGLRSTRQDHGGMPLSAGHCQTVQRAPRVFIGQRSSTTMVDQSQLACKSTIPAMTLKPAQVGSPAPIGHASTRIILPSPQHETTSYAATRRRPCTQPNPVARSVVDRIPTGTGAGAMSVSVFLVKLRTSWRGTRDRRNVLANSLAVTAVSL